MSCRSALPLFEFTKSRFRERKELKIDVVEFAPTEIQSGEPSRETGKTSSIKGDNSDLNL
ncbi:hypothetical protein [Natronoflexus pectinivorans]|uniref:Uncharacterized protein n=1 Tax=Natronoflexus pectinivorans TaxID=682526 RepID=A0A4R2GNA0_9BACT|nr:hypothetical protein [Natronoflexus pectinivorans]TCO10507.1 hypothetical protein EV194_101137 [Natronoflexus pectinivorans]